MSFSLELTRRSTTSSRGCTLAEAAPQGPLHFRLPGARGGLRKSFGRGAKRRSQAGMALLRIAELTPKPLMRTVGSIMSPPDERE